MKNKIIAIFLGIVICLLAQSGVAFGQVNIRDIVHEGGVSGFLDGVIAIACLYLLGYPLFFIVNLIRLQEYYGGASLKKATLQATNDNIHEFIKMVLVALFFIIPLSTIPVAIILAVLSGYRVSCSTPLTEVTSSNCSSYTACWHSLFRFSILSSRL